MGDFVTGLSDLANNKADTVPTATNSNTLIADEWNQVADACYDLRTAILSGRFFGLTSYNAPVSGASEARLRYFNGELQVSKGAGNYETVGGGSLGARPEDYGAVGDGVTDDGPALQDCFDDAIARKIPVVLSAKVYATAQELHVTSAGFQMTGVYMAGTDYAGSVIKATAPMRAILKLSAVVNITNVGFSGNRLAKTGIYFNTTSLSFFNNVSVSLCLIDGVFASGELDQTRYVSNGLSGEYAQSTLYSACIAKSSDLSFIAGTCSVTSGSPTVTFSGAPDLTTLGIVLNPNSPPYLHIFDGTTQRIRQANVTAISATTITLAANATFTASGCKFVLHNFTHSINDTNSFVNFSGGGNGTAWVEASVYSQMTSAVNRVSVPSVTAGVSSGGYTVTFTGSIDLWDLGIRPGDIVFVGSGGQARRMLVAEVPSPTTITTTGAFNYTATGLVWAICQGYSYNECFSSDNNINSFQGTQLHRGNGAGAFHFNGQTGPIVTGTQIDYQGGAAIVVGPNICVHTTLIHNYGEAVGLGGGWQPWLISGGQGVQIHAPIGPNTGMGAQVQTISGDGLWYGRDEIDCLNSPVRNRMYSTILEAPTLLGYDVYDTQNVARQMPDLTDSYNIVGKLSELYSWEGQTGLGSESVATATPLFNAPTGYTSVFVGVKNPSNPDAVTFQDKRILGGSGFYLQKQRLRMNYGRWCQFVWDGNQWIEVARGPGAVGASTGSPGNATQNCEKGRVAIAAGASSVVVTNNQCTSTSIVHATLQTNDATLTQILTVVPADGSFTIYGNALATGNCNVCWSLED